MFGLLELVLFLAGFSGTPKKAKKCTFFWVFNNSPSRDSLVPFFRFFPTSILANFECRNSRVAFLEDVYWIYGESMAIYVSTYLVYVSTYVCWVSDYVVIAIVCLSHCESMSHSLRW